MRRIFAQVRKELTQLVRDRLALMLALLLPAFLLVLMGTAISLTVDDMPLVVQDLDGSQASQRLVDAFRASLTFHVVAWPVQENPVRALAGNRVRGVLIIPAHFGRDLALHEAPQVQLLVDGTDANTAKLVAGYAQSVVGAYNARIAGRPSQGIQAVVRLWFNPGLDSKKFYGPGIFVLVLTLFPTLLAALSVAREGEEKTILQIYVSNISAHEYLLGKIFAIMVVFLAEAVILTVLLFTYFGVTLAVDPTPLLVGSVLYAFCVAAFGVMVGVSIPNQLGAISVVALGGFLLVFIMSGLLFPIENIPVQLRWISNLVWGRYYIEIVRDAFLQGAGWPATWYKALIIAAIGAVFYGNAWRSTRSMQLKY
ncbi:MAG TPA: ABC transporter permease [Candidatus Baltobacteraceae bacterium]|nr:ABC transporter permease [Candidatus Baltobacteraceae bacterium]